MAIQISLRSTVFRYILCKQRGNCFSLLPSTVTYDILQARISQEPWHVYQKVRLQYITGIVQQSMSNNVNPTVVSHKSSICALNIHYEGIYGTWVSGYFDVCQGRQRMTRHQDLQTFWNLKWLCRTKNPYQPCLPIHAMLNFLKIYRTEQNFTGHVLRSCGFRKSVT